MYRAIKIIRLFERKNMTAQNVALELGVEQTSARQWINAASIVLPIAEVGSVREGSRGPESIIYGLMK